jgi:quercetin dioxygenase-like cupin family protein
MDQINGVDYMTKLQDLLEHPPSFEDLIADLSGSFVEYEVEGGFSVGHGVLHDEDCAIQKNFASAGAMFPEHTHPEYEYIIIICGEGEVIIGDERKSFRENDCIVIKPGQSHSWSYTKHTKMIGITIPASKGYPCGQG